MEYIALLRGINVGGNHKVEMKRLKALLESLNCSNVSTYINSGNVFFESGESKKHLCINIQTHLENMFGFQIPTLIKTKKEIIKIANDIPTTWVNDDNEKTDVAYLFEEIDDKAIISTLPIKREFINIKYTSGAIVWNVKRVHANKSHLSKIIGHPSYPLMTIRNVNTARYLAEGPVKSH